jgi:hypothetical protein
VKLKLLSFQRRNIEEMIVIAVFQVFLIFLSTNRGQIGKH